MRILLITVIFGTFLFQADCQRKKRGLLSLLDLIDDYCDGEESCTNDVTEDLILYLSEEPYDPEDKDAGVSRFTVLLETFDSKCEGDEVCLELLYDDLQDRLLNGGDDDDDDYGDDDENLDYEKFLDEEDYDEEEFVDESGTPEYENENDSEEIENTVDEEEFESAFERYELNEGLDETILNQINKDECLQNRADCEKFVEKEEALGLNHIGDIDYDDDGEPIAYVPKSLFFKEELVLPEGGDDPEGF